MSFNFPKRFITIFDIYLFLLNINFILNKRRRIDNNSNNNNQNQNQPSNKGNNNKAVDIFLYTFFGVMLSLTFIFAVIKCIRRYQLGNRRRNQTISNENNINTVERRTNEAINVIHEPINQDIISKIKETNPLLSIIIEMLIQIGVDDACEYTLRNCFVLVVYDNEKDYFDQNCTICLEKFEFNSLTYRTNCDHIFHKDCIMTQIKTKLEEIKYKIDNNEKINIIEITCPNCKNNLIEKKTSNRKINKLFLKDTSDDLKGYLSPAYRSPTNKNALNSTEVMTRKRKRSENRNNVNNIIINNIVIDNYNDDELN